MPRTQLKGKTKDAPTAVSTVDEYISSFPGDVQASLSAVRDVVRRAVPGGEERISYRMPAMFRNGVVVYYAAFKKHLGLFPPVADVALRRKVARYAGPKGNLQFPLNEPLPLGLIREVVRARLAANVGKGAGGAAAHAARRARKG
jgi:uncharacterized protein YdhG (YjbR/CyaY superfamily)